MSSSKRASSKRAKWEKRRDIRFRPLVRAAVNLTLDWWSIVKTYRSQTQESLSC